MRRQESKRCKTINFCIVALFVLACRVHDLDTTKRQSWAESQNSKPTKLQDENCKRVYEWSLMNHWESDDESAINFSKLPQIRKLRVQRSWNSQSDRDMYAEMTITIRNKRVKLAVIDMQVFDGTQSYSFAAHNLWHRMIPLYHSWLGLQTAIYKYNLVPKRVVSYFNCEKHGKHLDDLPYEWEKMMGEVSCDETLFELADVIIQPPRDGFLWDLAWDRNLQCQDSRMFKDFASLFVSKSSHVEPTEPMGCFISRQGRPNRRVENFNETLTMMQEVFPRVQVLTLTQYHTTDETVQILQDCRVLFGVHGAGHTNALFARPGVAVVEMIGNAKPAYFKNINMLLGQHYESIYGDRSQGMSGSYTVNLTEARGALLRASEHARRWIQSHHHWR